MTIQSQQARQSLGTRLRDLRRDAGLTARALADACGWHYTKVSKLEHGNQTPSEANLRAWCQACAASDQVPDLIATVRAIELLYVEWRRTLKTGLRFSQAARNELHEQSKLIRAYEPGIVPGIFQTEEYARAVLRASAAFNQVPDDVEEAVAARLARQQLLHSAERRYMLVIETQALRTRVAAAAAMNEQLARLLSFMGMANVSLGIIPPTAERTVWPSAGFWIFDQGTVRVETPSAELTITQHVEIAVFEKRFGLLQQAAAYGRDARQLIFDAIDGLDGA